LVPADASAELRGLAARSMAAEDARWGMDVIRSGQSGSASGVLPLLLGHHWIRIAYEGAIMLRSHDPLVGVPALANLLRGQYAAITARGRHAAKLLDDTNKSYDQVLTELEEVLADHHARLTGRAARWLRWAETDLALYTLDGKVAGASVSAGYRLGVELADGGRIAGYDIRAVSEEWGATLAVLGAAALDGSSQPATLGSIRTFGHGHRDRLATRYLRSRFDLEFGLGLKAMLLLIEGDLNTSLRLLPLTSSGHEQPVFRAQAITAYHALTALRQVCQRHAGSRTAGLQGLRAALSGPAAERLLSRPGKRVRNRCMHYAIADPQVRPDPSRPMFGLVETVFPGTSWHDYQADVLATTSRLADVLGGWRADK